MSGATITFEIDGETVDAADAAWFQVAPCGCVSGATVVALLRVDMPPKLTEADAWATFYEGTAETERRNRAAGFTMRLGRRADVSRLMADCPHAPKWGVPETPALAGHAWATTRRFPKSADRQHLVPTEAVSVGDEWKYQQDRPGALCGRRDTVWHHDIWTSDAPTCRRCEARATKLAGGAA